MTNANVYDYKHQVKASSEMQQWNEEMNIEFVLGHKSGITICDLTTNGSRAAQHTSVRCKSNLWKTCKLFHD